MTVGDTKRKYVEGYLDYFEWSLEMQSPSVMGGLKEEDEQDRSIKDGHRVF